MRDRRREGGRRGALVAVAAVSIFVLSACTTTGVATLTGADDATPSPTASAASEDPEEALLAFTECMRENGIDMPDPVIRRIDGGGGAQGGDVAEAVPGDALPFDPNSDEFQAAQQACDHHLQGLGALEPGEAPELSAEQEQAFLDFAECMREHGIDMPDPGSGGIIVRPGSEEDFDPRSEEFQAAEEECRSHLDGVLDAGVEEVGP